MEYSDSREKITGTGKTNPRLGGQIVGKSELLNGVLTRNRFDIALQSEIFKQMEGYSGRFLSENDQTIRRYRRRWVADPLHQWSRIWEYTAIAHVLKELCSPQSLPLNILDAGSGLTFFPFYLASQHPTWQFTCCDQDPCLPREYANILKAYRLPIEFVRDDLTKLENFRSATFDAVYCISVLEHVPDRSSAINNLVRVLKPGGFLLLTLDISLDGNSDIPVSDASRLVTELGAALGTTIPYQLTEQIKSAGNDLVTTITEYAHHRDRLPWRYPAWCYQLVHLLRGKGWPQWPPNTAVAGYALRKVVSVP